VTQVTALFKEAGISNICVQVEKRTYFQHLQGLGVCSDRLHAMTHGFKTLGSSDFASFISDLWLVFTCCWNPSILHFAVHCSHTDWQKVHHSIFTI